MKKPGTTGPKPPAIECRGLRKSFDGVEVLKGVDLELRHGETLVILGHSGGGKSVLIKHMNGLLRPDEGSLLFEGNDICGLSERRLVPLRLKVAMLFQGGALFDSLSVEENVAFALKQHRLCPPSEHGDRVAELLELVGLEGTQSKMPSELSGGMRKRAALARSLAINPQVMLYDEPTTGLDPVTGAQINRLIRSLQSKFGLSSVVVTHDLASATFVADRMAFLYDGVIRCVGSVDEMIASGDPVVNEFLTLGNVKRA